MWKFRGHILCAATFVVVVTGACSSSTSPSSKANTSPSNAQQGDTINLSGTYALASYTDDSADGNSQTIPATSGNGANLVLTSTNFTLTWTGTFSSQNGQGTSGTYVAVDTSATVDRGTMTLNSTQGTQHGTYAFSTDTFTVAQPDGSGGTDITVWIKQ
jgi:hypothetical protein